MRLTLTGLALAAVAAAPPAATKSDAALKDAQTHTVPDIGAGQGVSFIGDKLYIYGDRYDVKPRVGVIREYTQDVKPTGRSITLTENGKPVITHPTGLTSDEKFGCYLGDTVDGKAVIYRLDWEKALKAGNLDGAILSRTEDDIAVNGCRPVFVTLGKDRYLATADYGDRTPQVRLYDPAKLAAAKKTSEKGILAYRFAAGPFNQNLAWDAKAGTLTCVQNVTAGVGWRLDVLDLAKAVKAGSAEADGVRKATFTLPYTTELEGYRALAGGKAVFVTAHPKENVLVGTLTRP